MDSTTSYLPLGRVFFCSGVALLVLGLVTQAVALWALGPALITLGVVFIALARSRCKARASSSSAGSKG